LLLASAFPALAQAQLASKTKAPAPQNFHLKLNLSRSSSLVDFKDGSRADSMDYELTPSYKTSYGTAKASLTYSQDLRDKNAVDAGDIPLTFDFKQFSPGWFLSATSLIPASKKSTKRDELQTALGGKITYINLPPSGEGFSFAASVSLSQNFHSYEEDINGAILNKYASNQLVNLGYSIKNWNLSFTGINRTRVTYQSSVKSTFELIEEIEYAVNDGISMAMGHTNGGSPLKPNGVDSNVELVNEDTSMIYGSLTLVY
jgi:hypothetical protein